MGAFGRICYGIISIHKLISIDHVYMDVPCIPKPSKNYCPAIFRNVNPEFGNLFYQFSKGT